MIEDPARVPARQGWSLFTRLLAGHLLIALVALAVVGVTLDQLLQRRATNQLRDRLVSEATIAREAVLHAGLPPDQALVRAIGSASGTRITVVGTDGVVLADSEGSPATMENHAARPEIRDALAGRVGEDQRTSATLDRPYLYVAIPARSGIAVRAALPATGVASQRAAVRRTILLTLLGVLALVVLVSMASARSLARPMTRISRHVVDVSRGRYDVIRPTGPRETQILAAAVNRMAEEIATRLDALRAETTLREEILSTLPEAVLLAGPGGRLLYANPAAHRLLGVSGTIGLPSQLTEEGTAEVTVHHPERRDLRAVSVRLGEGRRLIVAQDVTESKRVEAMRRDFVSDASHELKTPVAVILSVAETIRVAAEDDPDNVPRFASTLVDEARRLARIVEDLLDLARLEQVAPPPSPVSLSEIVNRETVGARGAARAKGLDFSDEISGGVEIPGDAADLTLAVRNLLDNAVRYTETGSVSVALSPREDGVEIVVTDTGVGIPAKDLPRIFERFYRIDVARSRETGGTGLGLSIVRHVVERHGGTVQAASELGRGSRFVIWLPRERRPDAAPTPPAPPATPPRP